MEEYPQETIGQLKFYERLGITPDFSHHTDGVYGGNLFENKREVKDIYEGLFQLIKYASRIRIRGEKLPENLILNDLYQQVAYIFKSFDLLNDIEQVYFGAASKNNRGYKPSINYQTITYADSKGLQHLLETINCANFVKYHVDRNNIVGLSQQFYRHKQDKDKFIKGSSAEIRVPTILADRIIPYSISNNLEFEDVMDCLNPSLLQREQGAYYTPPAYVEQMHQMLYKAIEEIPEGMDYVIIDRCAGTGNLQENLPDEILSHCILSTIEFNEYAILSYKYGDKCSVVIPNTDALAYDIIPAEHTERGVSNDYVRDKINDKNCVVILMENPPFSESGSGGTQNTGRKDNTWKKSYIMTQMKKECKGVVCNDLSNLFIWSGFKYYLTQPCDSYILYSPTKCWRNQNLINKTFAGGFLCNRKEFHAKNNSAMGCIWWKNVEDTAIDTLSLPPYSINRGQICRALNNNITIRKAYHNFTEAYDNRTFSNDEVGIFCECNGTEFTKDGRKCSGTPLYNTNIIGYLMVHSFLIDRKNISLTRTGLFKGHGFYLRKDNFIEKLPLFVAAAFPYNKWYKTDVYSKTYDGQGSYIKDNNFLCKCLIYTALTPKNKCRSFWGRDKRFYRNELCFDKKDTLAWRTLEQFISLGYALTDEEIRLFTYWDDVVTETQKTTEYQVRTNNNTSMRFGLWQISQEINIKIETGKLNKKGKPITVFKYPSLNTEINSLKKALQTYYDETLTPLLFQYELLK